LAGLPFLFSKEPALGSLQQKIANYIPDYGIKDQKVSWVIQTQWNSPRFGYPADQAGFKKIKKDAVLLTPKKI